MLAMPGFVHLVEIRFLDLLRSPARIVGSGVRVMLGFALRADLRFLTRPGDLIEEQRIVKVDLANESLI